MRSQQLHRRCGELIKRCALFRGMSDSELQAVLRFSHFRMLPENNVLAWQDDPCPAVYFVVTGSIVLKRLLPPNQTTILGYVQRGETIGEAYIVGDSGCPVTLSTVEESVLLMMEAEEFRQYLRRNPKLACQVMHNISRQLDSLVCYIARLKTYNAEQRVAAYILQQCNGESLPYGGNGTNHRQSDVAQLLGITPETFSRVISKFKQRGWITAGQGVFEVIDCENLSNVLG